MTQKLTFDSYQQEAAGYAVYVEEAYPFIGLTEEVGEFLSYAAKLARGDDLSERYPDEEVLKEKILKEAGDILWMLSRCLHEYGHLSLQEAAELNLKKLADRKARGVLQGSGDDR